MNWTDEVANLSPDRERKWRKLYQGNLDCGFSNDQSGEWALHSLWYLEVHWRAHYREYLKTEWWNRSRKRALRRAKFRCQLCNAKDTTLDVHHRRYDNLGFEGRDDVLVLCRICHEVFHERIGHVA